MPRTAAPSRFVLSAPNSRRCDRTAVVALARRAVLRLRAFNARLSRIAHAKERHVGFSTVVGILFYVLWLLWTASANVATIMMEMVASVEGGRLILP